MEMLSHIKDVIGDKCRVFSEAVNVDEEVQLIAFETQDLATIIKDVIQVCADACIDKESREAILEFLK
jgi:hypothetical protein